MKKLTEDGEGAAMATLDSTPGMGQPQYANRDADGSGDVPMGNKKKKKRKIKTFSDFSEHKQK